LFRDISLGIEEGQRIGFIGPNGSGKSTLLKILADLTQPDDGNVVARRKLRVAYVPQEESFPDDESIEQLLHDSCASLGFEAHEQAASIDSTITKIGFPDRLAKAGTLSGGWRKRLALTCALVQKPELLLLDEPTNHLDLDGVLWLENLLKNTDTTFVLVSHDRAFLQAIVNRVIELNPTYESGYLSCNGSYADFLESREQQLSAQAHLQKSLASKVRREIAWLQRGARARQTKAQGRIEDANKLIEDLAEVKRRNAMNTSVEIGFDASGRRTKELFCSKKIAKSFGGRKLFGELDLILTPGYKLGLVGSNGSGKTTLLKIIVGEMAPDAGTIKRADQLKVVWFDQNRAQLDKGKTLKESLCPTSDSVVYRGRSLHITTWAKKFLFRPDQLNMPISYLSGGEQARILIANLMLQPADILILDEPTNDLDIPSLEVLEESLEDFPGAVVLVSHDRMMLDTVSTQTLALNGKGATKLCADYEQAERWLKSEIAKSEKVGEVARKQTGKSEKTKTGLSTAEKRELSAMPETIEQAESKLSNLQMEMSKPHVATNYSKLQQLMREQEEAQKSLEDLFKRWEELESKAAASSAEILANLST